MTYQAPKDTIELDEFSNEVRLCGNCGHEVEEGTVHDKDEEGCNIIRSKVDGAA